MSYSKKVSRMLQRLNEDGWHYGGLPGLQREAENARSADRALIHEIAKELREDVRFEEFYHACINCGNCTSNALLSGLLTLNQGLLYRRLCIRRMSRSFFTR